ncbi:MAG: hypothetical protein Q9213_003794, partial [Squamulea squamosa]
KGANQCCRTSRIATHEPNAHEISKMSITFENDRQKKKPRTRKKTKKEQNARRSQRLNHNIQSLLSYIYRKRRKERTTGPGDKLLDILSWHISEYSNEVVLSQIEEHSARNGKTECEAA